ncbi:Dephospho-CoA kinase [compost metagenome]
MVAHAPQHLRLRRLVELRGMSEADAAARLASQVGDDARLRIADVVIDTAGALEDTERQVDELWASLDGHLAARAARP